MDTISRCILSQSRKIHTSGAAGSNRHAVQLSRLSVQQQRRLERLSELHAQNDEHAVWHSDVHHRTMGPMDDIDIIPCAEVEYRDTDVVDLSQVVDVKR